MAPKTVILCEGLGKKYRIRTTNSGHTYKALRETISKKCAAMLQTVLPGKAAPAAASAEDFWALQDVGFEVREGEILGIIGRNGAGKSTLLKLLSRITRPTTGRVRLHGRVGSLLEVGTGFHPELTGRENIFLNGAVLGMSRVEIKRKFDEIVAFAEVSRFLDTPVKRYSSGMYVRLAFAIAAHLEPEILIVDEVLAVGDAQFQNKCLGKLQNIAQEGRRTVLFVSHNMGAINRFCHRCLLLDAGRVRLDGSADEVVTRYLDLAREGHEGSVALEPSQSEAYFTKVSVLADDDRCRSYVSVTSGLKLQMEYFLRDRLPGIEISFSLYDSNGSKIFGSSLPNDQPNSFHLDPGTYVTTARIPGSFLAPGTYSISLWIHEPRVRFIDKRDHAIGFSVVETGSDDYRSGGQGLGAILVSLDWTVMRN